MLCPDECKTRVSPAKNSNWYLGKLCKASLTFFLIFDLTSEIWFFVVAVFVLFFFVISANEWDVIEIMEYQVNAGWVHLSGSGQECTRVVFTLLCELHRLDFCWAKVALGLMCAVKAGLWPSEWVFFHPVSDEGAERALYSRSPYQLVIPVVWFDKVSRTRDKQWCLLL